MNKHMIGGIVQWQIQRGLRGLLELPFEIKLFHFHGEIEEK